MLRRLREGAVHSGSALGEIIGLSKDAISKIERGKRQPSLNVFISLVDALGLDDASAMALARELTAAHVAPVATPASTEAA